MQKFTSVVKYILSWQWVKRFLYWLVVSAGTVSECVFLIASLWISVNATVHPLMLKVMRQSQTETLSQLAVSAFTSLPEIILGLAVVTTYGHIKTYWFHRRKSALVWAVLFGLPTLVFASLTMWTLTASSLQIGYAMPATLIATRALAGYVYGFLSMLFVLIGEPDNADYVAGLKEDYNQKVTALSKEIDQRQNQFEETMEQVKREFETTLHEKDHELNELRMLSNSQKEHVKALTEKASSLVRHDLANYPKVVSELIETGKATVQIDEAVTLTGLSRRRLNNANLKRHSRNRDLIMVNSLVEWLKTLPAPSVETVQLNGNGHFNHHEQDTDALHLPLYSVVETN